VAREEVNVHAQRLLQQLQEAAPGVIGRDQFDGTGQVVGQLEDQSRLRLGLEEGQILEERDDLLGGRGGAEELPG
jgi:hypothetical protein